MAAKSKKNKDDDFGKLIAENRKARHDFEVVETFEAGIQLFGPEVKSLRTNAVTIAESYAEVKGDELWLVNAHIPVYTQANIGNHEPRRVRRLLMHRREIEKLAAGVARQGMTLVPLKLYFNKNGRAKLLLGLAKGRKRHDKREHDKKRDWEREKGRLLRDKG